LNRGECRRARPVVIEDGHGAFVKEGLTSVIAKLADRDKGARGEIGNKLDGAGSERESGEVEFGFMGGIHHGAVGAHNGVGGDKLANVGILAIEGSEIRSTAGIEDGGSEVVRAGVAAKAEPVAGVAVQESAEEAGVMSGGEDWPSRRREEGGLFLM
jgi:hypothetical protein